MGSLLGRIRDGLGAWKDKHARSIIDPTEMSRITHSFSIVLSTGQGSMHETRVAIQDDEVSSVLPTGQEVLDLCQRMGIRRQASHALVLNLTKDEKPVFDDQANCETCLDLRDCGIISLHEYLDSGYSLLVKQRTTIALKLVTSVVKFHGTPWSTEIWTKEGMQFFRRPNTPGTIALVDVPFIVRQFPPKSQISKAPVEADMLELGIVLIEEWTSQEGLGASSDYLERTKRAIR